MNLIIDIGNTVAKLAVFDGDEQVEILRGSNHSLDCIKILCHKYPIDRCIIASVITLSNTIKKQLANVSFPVLTLDYKTPIPITNKYKTPETLGMDRLAAVVGANYLMPDRNLLVIDAGTALTYEFIDANATYWGGNISPGIYTRFKSLSACCDKLPLIRSILKPSLIIFYKVMKFSFDTKLKSIIFADRFLVLKGLNRILNYNVK